MPGISDEKYNVFSSGDNAGWLRERLGSESGSILDEDGKKLGSHKGAYTYTIGQRKGLNLTVPANDGSPRYDGGTKDKTLSDLKEAQK